MKTLTLPNPKMAQNFAEKILEEQAIDEERKKCPRPWNMDPTSLDYKLLSSPREFLLCLFIRAVSKAYPEVSSSIVSLRVSNLTFCDADYQCEAAMPICQQLLSTGQQVTPQIVAQNILNEFSDVAKITEKVEIAAAGFINVWLKKSFVRFQIRSLFLLDFALPTPRKRVKVVVDFSSPTVTKEFMHIGHLWPTLIGDSICNLLEYRGHDVLRFNYVADLGYDFGTLIAYLQDVFPNYREETPSIGNLRRFYEESKIQFKVPKFRFRKDEEYKKRAENCMSKLRNACPDFVLARKVLCDAFCQELRNTYDRLHIEFVERRESFYQKRMQDLVDYLQKRNILKDHRGKKVIKPYTIVRSDGCFTSRTLQLCAFKQRIVEEKADWIICVIDEGESALLDCRIKNIRTKKKKREICEDKNEPGKETSSNSSAMSDQLWRHFNLTFRGHLQRCAFYDPEKVQISFIGCASVLDENGLPPKVWFRDSGQVANILDEGVRRWRDKFLQKNRLSVLTEEELNETAEAVALGCLKYALLSHNRDEDYTFSDQEMFDESSSIIYLMKTYTRIKFITRGADLDYIRQVCRKKGVILTHEKEWKLVKVLLQFHDVLYKIIEDLCMHRLCNFLIDVAVSFLDLYNSHRTYKDIKGNDVQHHVDCIILCEVTASVMKKCFDILGIRV